MDTRHNGPHENVKGRQPGAPYNANYPIVHTRHNGPHENCFVGLHEFAVLMAFGSVFLRVRFIQST